MFHCFWLDEFKYSSFIRTGMPQYFLTGTVLKVEAFLTVGWMGSYDTYHLTQLFFLPVPSQYCLIINTCPM